MEYDSHVILELNQKLGLNIGESRLLFLSMHSLAYINEKGSLNDRSEFEFLIALGNAVLNFIITEMTFYNHTTNSNDSNVFNAEIRKIFISIFEEFYHFKDLYIGLDHEKNIDSNMNIISAMIGALYLEIGYEKIYILIEEPYKKAASSVLDGKSIDWKTSLHEYFQRKKGTINYSVINETGPSNDKTFTVEVTTLGKKAIGEGKRKKIAETEAARNYHLKFIPKSEWKLPTSYANELFSIIDYKELPHDFRKDYNSIKMWFDADNRLITQSFIHSSFAFENSLDKLDYTALATLGGQLQVLLYTEYIYSYKHSIFLDNKINFTKFRSLLIDANTTADIFDFLELEKFVKLGKGEKNRLIPKSIKADIVQSLIASVYITNKLKNEPYSTNLYSFFIKNCLNKFVVKSLNTVHFSPKTDLHELLEPLKATITYETNNFGLSHNKEFISSCEINLNSKKVVVSGALSTTKKESESSAAHAFLEVLKSCVNTNNHSTNQFIKTHISFFRDFFTEAKKLSYQLKNALLLNNALGNFGLTDFIDQNYLNAYIKLNRAIKNLNDLGLYDRQLFHKVIVGSELFVTKRQITTGSLKKLLEDMYFWLKNLNINSDLVQLKQYYTSLIDEMQIFSISSKEEQVNIDLLEMITNFDVIFKDRIKISYNDEEDYVIFGNKGLFDWVFYSTLKMLIELIDSTNNSIEKIHFNIVNHDEVKLSMTIQFNSLQLSKQSINELERYTKFLNIFYGKTMITENSIEFFFINTKNHSHDFSHSETMYYFTESNKILLGKIQNDLPISGYVHDLKNVLILLEKSFKHLKTGGSFSIGLNYTNLLNEAIEMTEKLLMFYKPQNIEYELIDMINFINSIKKEILSYAKLSQKVDFVIELLSSEIVSDKASLYSLIINLVKNGLEAIDENGKITLSIKIDLEQNLNIMIEDNGCGISNNILSNLFTSFGSSKKTRGGTGLGLPTIKKIVDYLYGTIECVSEVNHGTIFNIFLPNLSNYNNTNVVDID
jgi:dsRNA-specific ribonuclease